LAEGSTLLLDAAPSMPAWLDIGGQYLLPAEILVIEGKFAARLLAPLPSGDTREECDSAVHAEQNKRIDELTHTVEELRTRVDELSQPGELDDSTAFSGPEPERPERTPAEKIESVLKNPDASAGVLTMLIRSGRRIEAALALIAVGCGKASELLKRMDSEEIDILTFEIARIEAPEPSELSRALDLLDANVRDGSLHTISGVEYARTLLESAVGTQEAVAVINRLTDELTVRPLDFIGRSDPSQVFSAIKDEHPQIIALILSFLDNEKAALLFSWLEQDLQVEVIRRIASIKPVSPMILREIERVIEARLAAADETDDQCVVEGISAVLDILNLADQETELRVIEALEKTEPETARALKDGMFVFEDIVLLDDPSLRHVIAEVDTKTLAAALAPVQESVQESFFRNMDDPELGRLKDEIGNLGQILKEDALAAQHAVVAVLRSLEETGQIRVR
jgi:flagellar motor switch protein FliG